MKSRTFVHSWLAFAALACAVTSHADVPVPAPGTSPRIDAIKKAGVLRIGVLANAPWLVENTSGAGDKWSGPAWMLAEEYARRLGVKLEAVPVSHEFLASPGVAASGPAIICAKTYGSLRYVSIRSSFVDGQIAR